MPLDENENMEIFPRGQAPVTSEAGTTTINSPETHAAPEHGKAIGLDATVPSSQTSTSADVTSEHAPKKELHQSLNPEASRTKLQTAVIMMCLMSSVFLAALDITIVTTALPTISEHFHSDAGYTWIGSGYLLANAASTPSWGKFSDIWGRKSILLIAAGIFFVGSLIAGLSVNIGMLITARAIQGIGGGGLLILANICIGDLFSIANRGLYYGMIGMVWALASATGPIVGGAFTQKVTWRWCFFVNLPITGTVMMLLFFFLHLDNPKTPIKAGLKAVDWFGSLTVVGGTLMILLGLTFGGISFPWKSATVICLIVFGAVVASIFVLIEWKVAKYPVMPLRLFQHSSNVAAFGVCFIHGFVFIGGTYYLPLYFQAVLGARPLLSGVYQLPFALSLSFTSVATGIFIKKTGTFLPPIYFALAVMTLGFGLLIDLPLTRTWGKIIPYEIIAGIGVGPLFQAPLIAIQSKVSPRDIATATATFNFVRNLATATSVVIGGVVFQNQLTRKAASLGAALGPRVAAELSGGSAGANVAVIQALPVAQRTVAQAAFRDSLRAMWILYAAAAAAGILAGAGIGSQVLSTDHSVVRTGLAAEEANRLEMKEAKRRKRRGEAAAPQEKSSEGPPPPLREEV